MCGIAGIINTKGKPVALKQLQMMAHTIEHRGPDDEGFFLQRNVGLAFRRLAIIDLSPAGHQPMTNEDGTIYVIFNGEIYNYLELRPILQERGHRFQSKTDTEVIVHAYEEYGKDCVKYLKGMFAFAIWDSKRQRLFCARDRFGIKPYYYTRTPSSFLFGSEIKAILAVDRRTPKLNFRALNEYFTFQNVLSDETLFSDIRILPPAHTLTLERGSVALDRYWEPTFSERRDLSLSECTTLVQNQFEQAVVRHLMSDVPVGSHSSGGMDSGSIVAVASRHIQHLMTFTGGFDTTGASGLEMFFDERRDSELIARTFNTQHYEMVIHAGDMAWIFPKLIWHLEDLRVGMCYQNYYINQLASKFVKVVLAGTGGDELFAGYPWRYQIINQKRSLSDFHNTFYSYWSRLIPDAEKPTAFSREAWATMRHFSARDSYNSVFEHTQDLSPLNRALYFELKTFLHGLLTVEDKVSSAHSIETRVPFLDHDLVDLALTIPGRMKVYGNEGKYVLRRALRPLLPKEILKKRKQGFSAPEETWYRGKAYEYIRSTLLSRRALERGIFQRSFLQRVIESHHTGKKNNRLLIWSLLSLEWWNRIFIDHETPSHDQSYRLGS